MSPILRRTLLFAVCLSAALSANAEIIRDRSLLLSIQVQGVALNMTPEQAFEHLVANGYSAGNIKTFADWTTGGIELVRGDTQSPEGLSSITLGRQPGRLIRINEQINRPRGERFDLEGEIGRVREHFGIADDERKCRVGSKGAGACSVYDSKEASIIFGLQVWPTMRWTQLAFPAELF